MAASFLSCRRAGSISTGRAGRPESRFRRWPEARWLVYPVLILVGIKLVLEDFPHGQPATLFVALALVGGALLLVARLLTQEKIEA